MEARRRRHGPETLACMPKRSLHGRYHRQRRNTSAHMRQLRDGSASDVQKQVCVCYTAARQHRLPPNEWCSRSRAATRHAAIPRRSINHADAAFLQVDGRRHPQLVSTLPLKHTPATRTAQRPRTQSTPHAAHATHRRSPGSRHCRRTRRTCPPPPSRRTRLARAHARVSTRACGAFISTHQGNAPRQSLVLPEKHTPSHPLSKSVPPARTRASAEP